MPPIYSPDLLDALEELVEQWEGYAWRRVIEGLDPTQPNTRGARWNPDGVEALYFSLTAEGAEAEMAKVIERQPRPVRRPLKTFRFRLEMAQVADITDDALADVGFPTDALTGERWKLPAHVGGAAAWLEMAGLLVPSARHADANLVVFVNNLQPSDVLEIAEA